MTQPEPVSTVMFFILIPTAIWRTFLIGILSTVPPSGTTQISISDPEGTRYHYDIEECPGGIQIRDVDQWFSKNRDSNCICGEGSMLQFNGKTDNRHSDIYSIGFPENVGLWDDYHLSETCELLKGNTSSVLFINAKKYENPANFPTRAIELLLETSEENRVAGVHKIALTTGQNRRHDAAPQYLMRTVILNTAEPVLMVKDPDEKYLEHVCAYNRTFPEVILAKYITTTWGNQNLDQNCESKIYPPYQREKYRCMIKSNKFQEFTPPSEENQPALQFRQLLLTMAEVAIRMKYAEKFVTFTIQDHPYAAILQHSCRVFHRAFPDVVRWETLMNAVTLFGVAFEGLVPTSMEGELFNQMKIFLGRCTLQERRRQQQDHKALLLELCPAIREFAQLNSSVANLGEKYNGVVELLWKVVQFSHAVCFSSSDHHSNVYHAYTLAMMELFSAPAVQLLWYQQGKGDYRQVAKAMIHVFPELPDHVLPTMDLLLGKLKFETHASVLQRPTVPNLDERDMRCAGHGKLIWGGKACCYQRSEDNKFYFFNKVAFAKL